MTYLCFQLHTLCLVDVLSIFQLRKRAHGYGGRCFSNCIFHPGPPAQGRLPLFLSLGEQPPHQLVSCVRFNLNAIRR